MKRYHQFNRLVIDDFVTDTWEHPLHNHNHFEIIFIRSGTGIHHLNKRLVPYKEGHLYLLGPEDEHEFIVQETTHFSYFKFTKSYFDEFENDNPVQWGNEMSMLLHKKWGDKRNLLTYSEDVKVVDNLFTLIVKEYHKNDAFSKQLIFRWFTSLLLVLKRNQFHLARKEKTSFEDITEALLTYIEMHIYHPSLVTQKKIAEHFHYSPHYIGVLFKEKVGVSLKNYIQEYRYHLLKQRLQHKHIMVKQLVSEFGFTDVSHLHKFVKRQSGKTLSQIRQEHKESVA